MAAARVIVTDLSQVASGSTVAAGSGRRCGLLFLASGSPWRQQRTAPTTPGSRAPSTASAPDHRGDDHDRRLNRQLGQDVSSKPRLVTPIVRSDISGRLKLTVPSADARGRTV
jgi:hypothetical protein